MFSKPALAMMVLLTIALLTSACSNEAKIDDQGAEKSILLTSPAFADGEAIPPQYTCDGDDISPPLEWTNVPAETKSFVLIVDDPDAPRGTWLHWLVYDLPGDTRELPESASGIRQGKNSWKDAKYGGPCPPSGTHRYFFKLYALDAGLGLGPGASHNEVVEAMEKHHILARGELVGTYQKQ